MFLICHCIDEVPSSLNGSNRRRTIPCSAPVRRLFAETSTGLLRPGTIAYNATEPKRYQFAGVVLPAVKPKRPVSTLTHAGLRSGSTLPYMMGRLFCVNSRGLSAQIRVWVLVSLLQKGHGNEPHVVPTFGAGRPARRVQ